MGAQRVIGVILAVAGVGVMIGSRLIRVLHVAIPPSKEEVAVKQKRRNVFGVGAVISLFGLLLLLVP